MMDFVASVEDEFDILITMNMQAEIETVGQLVDAVETLQEPTDGHDRSRRDARQSRPTRRRPAPRAATSSPSSTR